MLHEDRSKLSDEILDMKRAIDSLTEELQATDWYNQRAEVCKDENLKKILMHNAGEEKEHASMLLGWISQNDEKFAKELRDYLFAGSEDLTKIEANK